MNFINLVDVHESLYNEESSFFLLSLTIVYLRPALGSTITNMFAVPFLILNLYAQAFPISLVMEFEARSCLLFSSKHITGSSGLYGLSYNSSILFICFMNSSVNSEIRHFNQGFRLCFFSRILMGSVYCQHLYCFFPQQF